MATSNEDNADRIVELLGQQDDMIGLVASPVYGDALHFIDGELCACSHGLKCGPLRDTPNTVIPDGE